MKKPTPFRTLLLAAACLLASLNYATAQTKTALSLTWNPVTTGIANGAPVTLTTPVTYTLYQGPTCNTLTKVQTGLTTPYTTVITSLTPATDYYYNYCFTVTANSNSIESAQSKPVQITLVLH